MISDYTRYRIYEILPGLSIWLTIVLAILLSFVWPIGMIYFILLFDLYWVLKAIHYAMYLTVSWRRYKKARRVNWRKEIENRSDIHDIHHIVFLTIYNESWEVAEPSIRAIAESAYNKASFVLVIAGEGKAEDHCREMFKKTKETFAHCFFDIVGTIHPAGQLDEIPGKASNLAYAEKEIDQYVRDRGWDPKRTIATIFDTDAICDSAYFPYLTYTYIHHPNPTRSSYQPIPLYFNNYWESPTILRLMGLGTSFWLMVMLTRQDSLHTFSSYSISWQALQDIGFHDKTVIGEDARLFYQCVLRYTGEYEVTSLYVPVSMDTVRGDTWYKSLKNLYVQQRRWAYGVEQIPYLLWNFYKKRTVLPWMKKVKWLFVEWESKWSWCCSVLLITIFGRLPLAVASDQVRQSTLFFNAPTILSWFMNIAAVALVLSIALSVYLLPKKSSGISFSGYLFTILQWLLLPISLLLFGAFPAIDAVTRLMFGKYLGYVVAQKKRG